MSGLGLSTDVQRLGVTFMGLVLALLSSCAITARAYVMCVLLMLHVISSCFGALSGMKAARAFASENPRNRVLVVCTELCSLHMQLDDAIDNMVTSTCTRICWISVRRCVESLPCSLLMSTPHTLSSPGWFLSLLRWFRCDGDRL